jgi:pyruvate/2-oxoglutarate dehydrogenase complex dihydrolipoamide dehydrogenase (E3) component
VDDQETVTDLQDSSLLDIDPDALREAEKIFAQGILDTMSGKEVAKATYEDTRVVVIMADGSEYYFYGFMGESRA